MAPSSISFEYKSQIIGELPTKEQSSTPTTYSDSIF